MTRFEDTLTQDKKKGGTNHHERTAHTLNTHQRRRAFKPLQYTMKGRDLKV